MLLFKGLSILTSRVLDPDISDIYISDYKYGKDKKNHDKLLKLLSKILQRVFKFHLRGVMYSFATLTTLAYQ